MPQKTDCVQNILLECARRDLSKSGVYFYHAGVMARAARDFRVCWGRRLLPALSDFGTGRPSSRLDDTWCPPIITEHFATISSGCGGARARSAVVTSSALLMVASRSRQRATPRHVGARLAVCFALRSPQRTPAPSPRFSCAWVLPPEAAASSAGSSSCPPAAKRICGPSCIS